MVTASAAQPDGLIGRRSELAELRMLVAGSPLLAVSGTAGIGKTRLLRALMTELAGDFPDGAFYAGFRDLQQPDLVPGRLARALRISLEPGIPLADTIGHALAGQRVLLVLDSIEGVTGECRILCERLLALAPGLRIVAAGQEPLGLDGETAWPVPPLGLPAAGESDPERAVTADAVALFADRAVAADPDFRLEAANCAAVARICRLAGGVPLAIELAAAHLPGASVQEISDSLAEAAADSAASHAATMQAVIWWSHRMLSEEEQLLLRRLSVLHTFTLEMAEQVCAGRQLPAEHISGLLASLAGQALIRLEPREPKGRCRMPGAVRDFAAQRLAEAGEDAVAGRRLRDYAAQRADYVVRIARATVPVTWPVLRDMFSDYDADARNIRTALAWCLDHGDIEIGLRMCAELRIFWISIGALPEAARWLDAFLGTDLSALPGAVTGPALADRAQVAFGLGDLPGALSRGLAAVPLCREAGDTHFTAIALNVLARVALAQGRPADALRYSAESLELSRQSGDWWNEAYALNHRTRALTATGDLEQARECGQAGLDLALGKRLHWAAALIRTGLADIAVAQGDLPAARDLYLAALPFMQQAMPKPEAARCLVSLADVALRQGELGAAREYLAESLQLSLASGSREAIARALLAFADLLVREGSPARAVKVAATAAAQREAVGLPPLPADETRRCQDAADGMDPDEAARLTADGRQLTARAAARIALAPPAPAPAG